MESNAVSPTAGRRSEWSCLLTLMLGYGLLFLAEYPPLPGIEDEIGYVNQALVWSRGAISGEAIGYPDLAGFEHIGDRQLPRRHPGRSLLILPLLMAGGVRATFVSGLVIHLVTVAAAAKLLARLGRSPLWAVLVLFHPTLALYSRTIMADEAAGTGLLLAALAITSPSRLAGLWAGLAVGLAALMRYQAGLVLPLVAGTFWMFPGRVSPRRDAALCLIAGGAAGALIVAYNLAIYGSPMDPFSVRPGYFSWRYAGAQLPFYAEALMVVWPGMLFAPVLDRSPLRWLVRGVCAVFLAMFSIYYFHDRDSRWLGEMILGQRLLQVALPLWVVSYAGVVDDWFARPLRQLHGEKAWRGLVALVCAGLLAATAVSFDRHQRHLDALRVARAELVAHVPAGSLIVCRGAIFKLLGIPLSVPRYRLREVDFGGQWESFPRELIRDLEREPRPWYLAVLHREPSESFGGLAAELIERFKLERIPLRTDLVSLYEGGASRSAVASPPRPVP